MLDANGDGRISLDEWMNGWEKMQPKMQTLTGTFNGKIVSDDGPTRRTKRLVAALIR